MILQSAAEFGAMGGYGVYVWGSMGVSAALWVLEVWQVRWGRQHALDAVCEAMDAAADTDTATDRSGQQLVSPPPSDRLRGLNGLAQNPAPAAVPQTSFTPEAAS